MTGFSFTNGLLLFNFNNGKSFGNLNFRNVCLWKTVRQGSLWGSSLYTPWWLILCELVADGDHINDSSSEALLLLVFWYNKTSVELTSLSMIFLFVICFPKRRENTKLMLLIYQTAYNITHLQKLPPCFRCSSLFLEKIKDSKLKLLGIFGTR